MKLVASIAVAVVALLHVYFLVLEMFLWDRPFGLRTFGMSAEQAAASKALAMNQGLYNGFLAAGLAWGVIAADFFIQYFFLACVMLAGVFGALTASRKILFVQAVPAALALGLLLFAPDAAAQFNPLTIIGRAVTTAMDVRTKDEVAADTEISAAASKRLLDDEKAEWAGVTLLVFAQHAVIAGAVKTPEVRKRVEALVRQDKRIRSFRNELQVGDVGSLARDTLLETRINAALTAAEGVASVNMRWCATGGRVVLMGVAQSKDEAALATSRIREVEGVKSLVSHLRIVPAAKK